MINQEKEGNFVGYPESDVEQIIQNDEEVSPE